MPRYLPKAGSVQPDKPWQQGETLTDLRRVWGIRNDIKTNVPAAAAGGLRAIFRLWRSAARLVQASKQLRRNARVRRKHHWMNLIAEAETARQHRNPMKFFQVISRLAPRSNRERVQVRTDTGSVMTPSEEAAALASYWRQIYSKSKLAPYSWSVQHPLNITEEELLHALLALKPRKAVSADAAPAGAWKALAPQMSRYLCSLLKELWSTGLVKIPEHWTTSDLHFLTKPGKLAKRVQDLRPIALQSPAAMHKTCSLVCSAVCVRCAQEHD